MLNFIAAAQSDGVGFSDILRDIPHDGPAFVVYTLLILFGVGMWLGTRKKQAK